MLEEESRDSQSLGMEELGTARCAAAERPQREVDEKRALVAAADDWVDGDEGESFCMKTKEQCTLKMIH